MCMMSMCLADMSGWSVYIECIADGETKGLVKKQMISDDFAFWHVYVLPLAWIF